MKPEHYAHQAATPWSELRRTLVGRLADVAILFKLRIGVFVTWAAFTGGLLAAGPEASLGRVLLAALAIGLVSSGSCAFNQILERDVDRRMRRTAGRPLPSGRMSVREAVFWGTASALTGTLVLALGFGPLSAFLGLATLVGYALVYTPLKRETSFNTLVGAIPGAMPPLLGYVALAGAPGPWGWALFAIVFAWQFPHFLAIAWLYRDDYRRAGMKMLPALPGTQGAAGRQAFVYSLLLLPVSLLPAVRGEAGITYTSVALFVGLAYCVAAAAFALREDERRARALLVVSLIHLPVLLSGALCDPVVSLVLRPS